MSGDALNHVPHSIAVRELHRIESAVPSTCVYRPCTVTVHTWLSTHYFQGDFTILGIPRKSNGFIGKFTSSFPIDGSELIEEMGY